jgi:hypothetical protein
MEGYMQRFVDVLIRWLGQAAHDIKCCQTFLFAKGQIKDKKQHFLGKMYIIYFPKISQLPLWSTNIAT